LDIDDAIDALGDALIAAGVDPPAGPTDLTVLEEITAAISPLKLPADVRRFWARVDPKTVCARMFPELCQPEFALESWLANRKESFNQPDILMMVGYTSWSCMSVELDAPSGGGTLFSWGLADGDYARSFDSLGDWLARIAALISAGSYERSAGERGTWLSVRDPRDHTPIAAREEGSRVHPVYGEAQAIARDPVEWPAHWLRASGLEAAEILPRGATHTLAAALASDPETELRATLVGRVTTLSGSIDTRVRVTDGTDAIDIHCPGSVTLLGPVLGCAYEFDVVIPPGARLPASASSVVPDIPDDPDEALAVLTAVFQSRYGGPVGAIATAVRPLDPPTA
jgi:hypothetical protein